jgi:hypothetical protein
LDFYFSSKAGVDGHADPTRASDEALESYFVKCSQAGWASRPPTEEEREDLRRFYRLRPLDVCKIARKRSFEEVVESVKKLPNNEFVRELDALNRATLAGSPSTPSTGEGTEGRAKQSDEEFKEAKPAPPKKGRTKKKKDE